MQCAESLRLQAYFDSELDASSAHEVERHLDHCVECRGLLNDLKLLRDGLRRELPIERPPGYLRARILAAIDQEGSPARPSPVTQRARPTAWRLPAFWAGAFSGLGGAAAAAALAWLLILPTSSNVLVSELVNAHVNSLLPDHLIAVVSTDRHTVKPWFAGHADVSPSVADFEAQGYKLIGGRTDTVQNQRAAVVVYRHGAHTINVFSWASDRPAVTDGTTRNGYHLDFWKEGNLQYCAISDTGWDELQGLVRLLRELAQHENSPA
jgi:anti-sigma factor RsiW